MRKFASKRLNLDDEAGGKRGLYARPEVELPLEDEALLRLIQQELMKRCKEEQDPGPPGDAGRSRAQNDAAQARPRLEL